MRRFKYVVVCSAVAALVNLLPVVAPTTLAAPAAHSTLSVSANPANTCIVHNIVLHGRQPATVSCATYSTGHNLPDVSEGYCQFNSTTLTLEIYSDISGDWCFYYQGYIGLGGSMSGDIYGVVYIASYNGAYGWVDYYQPPYAPGTGIRFAFGSNSYYGNPPFTGNQKITQVDVVGWSCLLFC